MKRVGMFDAKTRFSEIVAAAARGETTVVTKKGKPVAEIGPIRSDERAEVRRTIERLRRHGRSICENNGGALGVGEILGWIREGRRYT